MLRVHGTVVYEVGEVDLEHATDLSVWCVLGSVGAVGSRVGLGVRGGAAGGTPLRKLGLHKGKER